MALLDLLGRRWTLRLGWELRDGQAQSFRELQRRCDSMSASVLNERLGELRDAQLVELEGGGYRLTPLGGELMATLLPLDRMARRWARQMQS